jgi:hypothetical protein
MKKIAFIALFVAVLMPFVAAHAAQTKKAERTLDAYAPFEELLQITPSNSTTYSPPLRGCIVEVAGDLAIETTKAASEVVITVIVGQMIPAMISKVKTGTTATIVCGR